MAHWDRRLYDTSHELEIFGENSESKNFCRHLDKKLDLCLKWKIIGIFLRVYDRGYDRYNSVLFQIKWEKQEKWPLFHFFIFFFFFYDLSKPTENFCHIFIWLSESLTKN